MVRTCFQCPAAPRRCISLPCLPAAQAVPPASPAAPANEMHAPLPTLLGGLRTSLRGGAAREAMSKVDKAVVKAAASGAPSLASPASTKSSAQKSGSATSSSSVFASPEPLAARGLHEEGEDGADQVHSSPHAAASVRSVLSEPVTPHAVVPSRSMRPNSQADLDSERASLVASALLADRVLAVSQGLASRALETSQVIGARALEHGRDACVSIAHHGSEACVATAHKVGELAVQSWPHILEASQATGRGTAMALHHALDKFEGCLQRRGPDECSDGEEAEEDREEVEVPAEEGEQQRAGGHTELPSVQPSAMPMQVWQHRPAPTTWRVVSRQQPMLLAAPVAVPSVAPAPTRQHLMSRNLGTAPRPSFEGRRRLSPSRVRVHGASDSDSFRSQQ